MSNAKLALTIAGITYSLFEEGLANKNVITEIGQITRDLGEFCISAGAISVTLLDTSGALELANLTDEVAALSLIIGATTIPLYAGRVLGDSIWDEKTKTRVINIESAPKPRPIGTLLESTYPNIRPSAIGKMIPIVYGIARNVPAVCVFKGATAILAKELEATDATAKLVGYEDIVQNQLIELMFGRIKCSGTLVDDTFTFTSKNMVIASGVTITATEYDRATINVHSSVQDLSGLYFQHQNGSNNACLVHDGYTVLFARNWVYLNADWLPVGVISEVAGAPRSTWAKPYQFYLHSIGLSVFNARAYPAKSGAATERDNWYLPEGSKVTNPAQGAKYLAAETGTILSVKAELDGDLVDVPSSYYSISGTTITLATALGERACEKWGDDLWVTVQGNSITDPVDIIKNLLPGYSYQGLTTHPAKANFAILDQVDVVDLLKRVCQSAMICVTVEGNTVYITDLNSSTSLKTLTDADMILASMQRHRQSIDEVFDAINVQYYPNYHDEASVAAVGGTERILTIDSIYSDIIPADELAANALAQRGLPFDVLTVGTFLEDTYALLPGQVVTIGGVKYVILQTTAAPLEFINTLMMIAVTSGYFGTFSGDLDQVPGAGAALIDWIPHRDCRGGGSAEGGKPVLKWIQQQELVIRGEESDWEINLVEDDKICRRTFECVLTLESTDVNDQLVAPASSITIVKGVWKGVIKITTGSGKDSGILRCTPVQKWRERRFGVAASDTFEIVDDLAKWVGYPRNVTNGGIYALEIEGEDGTYDLTTVGNIAINQTSVVITDGVGVVSTTFTGESPGTVKIRAERANAVAITREITMVDQDPSYAGRVKVNTNDALDYLEDQFLPMTKEQSGNNPIGNVGFAVREESGGDLVIVADVILDDDDAYALKKDSTDPTRPTLRVRYKNSITIDAGSLQLVNDNNAPLSFRYYGTDSSAVKGFHPLSDFINNYGNLTNPPVAVFCKDSAGNKGWVTIEEFECPE